MAHCRAGAGVLSRRPQSRGPYSQEDAEATPACWAVGNLSASTRFSRPRRCRRRPRTCPAETTAAGSHWSWCCTGPRQQRRDHGEAVQPEMAAIEEFARLGQQKTSPSAASDRRVSAPANRRWFGASWRRPTRPSSPPCASRAQTGWAAPPSLATTVSQPRRPSWWRPPRLATAARVAGAPAQRRIVELRFGDGAGGGSGLHGRVREGRDHGGQKQANDGNPNAFHGRNLWMRNAQDEQPPAQKPRARTRSRADYRRNARRRKGQFGRIVGSGTSRYSTSILPLLPIWRPEAFSPEARQARRLFYKGESRAL